VYLSLISEGAVLEGVNEQHTSDPVACRTLALGVGAGT
jgi:hypothetical protein